jgi:dTDP-glucose 4,6-dehydratase
MSEKFLVIGSNSYTGAAFVDYLLEQGALVIGTSRSAEPHQAFLPHRWQDRAGRFTFHRFDLNSELDPMFEVIKRERPTHVVNFAAQSMVGESWKNPDHWMMTNVVSTVRLHERLRQLDFLERYVHVTTPEVYGSTSGWITEDSPFNPSTPYAVSRAASDMSLRTYFATYKFPVLFTRAANVYGPGQPLYRIIPRTVYFARIGRMLQLHGGGYSERSFIHGRDVADATLRIAREGRLGDTYHISTTRLIAIRDLVEMILKNLGKRAEDSVEVVGERLGKDAAYMLDSKKLRGELGWNDRVSLEEGVAETIRWVDRFLPALREQSADYIHKP